MPGQTSAPLLVEAGVHDAQHRPDQPLGVPRVARFGAGEQDHERGRVEKTDTGGDAVLPSRLGAEAMRKPLGHPSLDTLGRNDDDVFGERIGGRRR